MTPIATASQKAAKRREVMLLWIKQLMGLHERAGTVKPAAAGWLAAIFALRAADRVDAGAQWGRIGDEIIDDLEWGYRQALGAEAEEGIAVAHRLLETHERPHIEISMGGKKTDVNPSTLRQMAARAAEVGRKAQAPASHMQDVVRKTGLSKSRFTFKPSAAGTRRPLSFARRPATAASARPGASKGGAMAKAATMAKPAPGKAKRPTRKASAKKR